MADALEQAVGRVMAGSLARTLHEQRGIPSVVCLVPSLPRYRRRKKEISRARFIFVLKSLASVLCIVAVSFAFSAVLFAPELSRGSGAGVLEGLYSRIADIVPEACLAKATNKSAGWKKLSGLDRVKEALRSVAVFYVRPEELAALVLFHAFWSVIKGEGLRMEYMEEDLKNDLPCQWLPVYEAIKGGFPARIEMPAAYSFHPLVSGWR